MPHTVESPAPHFEGMRKHFTHIQTYKTTLEQLFPLLCPVREGEYLSRWSCDVIYLKSGLIEQGGIFTTSDQAGTDVWVISSYIPSSLITFVRVNALRTSIYSITVLEADPGEVRLKWEQTVTGLNLAGNAYVDGLSQEDITNLLADMERRLQYYLDTGAMMTG